MPLKQLRRYIQTLAEQRLAGKAKAMRSIVAAVLLVAIMAFPGGCRQRQEGPIKVVVIGEPPRVRDPALGPLSQSDQLLLANVAQGLVSFDPTGNIVAGLAERWTVTDDGLSYIFRLSPAKWSDGRKVTAEQVARLLKRQLAPRSKNSLKDRFGSVEDIVAMTDRVLEIRLVAPRPELLSLLAAPQMAILRNGQGTGPFIAARDGSSELKLTREIISVDDESSTGEELLLGGSPAPAAIQAFAAGRADLVLGGTFADLPLARRVKLSRGSLRFDPASGLFGLVPRRAGGTFGKAEVRQLLSRAIDRDSFVAALGVPGLVPRATLLEPGLEGVPPPAVPEWMAARYADRLPTLQADAKRLFHDESPTVRIAVSDSPGAALLLRILQRSWGNIGVKVERAERPSDADFAVVDELAPSAGPAWFVRHFRCTQVAVCDLEADELMDAARSSPVPGQRYALLDQAASLIDSGALFMPITAPIRWSLVSGRIQNFAGNRYARHTLIGLEGPPSTGG